MYSIPRCGQVDSSWNQNSRNCRDPCYSWVITGIFWATPRPTSGTRVIRGRNTRHPDQRCYLFAGGCSDPREQSSAPQGSHEKTQKDRMRHYVQNQTSLRSEWISMYKCKIKFRVRPYECSESCTQQQTQRKDKDRPTRVASKLSYLQMRTGGCDRATGLMPVPEMIYLIKVGLAFITPAILVLMWSKGNSTSIVKDTGYGFLPHPIFHRC